MPMGSKRVGARGSGLGPRSKPDAERRQTASESRVPSLQSRSLSHVDATGTVRMVDVSSKETTAREAVAGGRITMSREAIRQIRAGAIKKGDPLQTARLAGIMAAKRTAELIPLCHPLPITFVEVTL